MEEHPPKECPLCKRQFRFYGISRFDDNTRICGDCAEIETMFVFSKYSSRFWETRARQGTFIHWQKAIFEEYFVATERKKIEEECDMEGKMKEEYERQMNSKYFKFTSDADFLLREEERRLEKQGLPNPFKPGFMFSEVKEIVSGAKRKRGPMCDFGQQELLIRKTEKREKK